MKSEKKTERYDSIKTGLIVGLISPVVGFVIYGLYWSWRFHRSFSYFTNDVFAGSFRSAILSLSLLINLIPFFIFIRSDRYKSSRGVMFAVFIYVPVVLYYKFA